MKMQVVQLNKKKVVTKQKILENDLYPNWSDRIDIGHEEAKHILRAEPDGAASLNLPRRKWIGMSPGS